MFGKHHTIETRKKISKKTKGLPAPSKAFKPGNIPWNKGLKGVQVSWNKGLTKSDYQNIKRSLLWQAD